MTLNLKNLTLPAGNFSIQCQNLTIQCENISIDLKNRTFHLGHLMIHFQNFTVQLDHSLMHLNNFSLHLGNQSVIGWVENSILSILTDSIQNIIQNSLNLQPLHLFNNTHPRAHPLVETIDLDFMNFNSTQRVETPLQIGTHYFVDNYQPYEIATNLTVPLSMLTAQWSAPRLP